MAQIVEQSMLPKMTLDVSHNSVPVAVESIADWLEATGGMYMK
jgi:hypothetical protein